jgi:hypothetical protein
MSKKHAFVVYAGTNETGRVFHALTHARQAHERGDVSELYFAAEGTGWPGVLADKSHFMHELFDLLMNQGVVQGACMNCSVAFGNRESAETAVGLVKGPECSFGQIDILGLEDQGYRVWPF